MREGDRETFKRLAEKRVNNCLKYIRLIGNLSNRTNYEYDDKQVKAIFKALQAEIKETEARFVRAPRIRFNLEQ